MEKYPNNKFSPRHFIMIPFEDENFIKDYKELCDLLEKEKPKGYDFELLQKPGDVFDSKERTRVVFAKMKEDESYRKIELIIDLIIKTLIKENVISKNDIESYHISFEQNLYKIVLHLTLLNTMFLNKILKKKNKKPIKSFNSQDILAVMYKKNLTSCPLNKINFCVMREDKSIGKYELVKSYDL